MFEESNVCEEFNENDVVRIKLFQKIIEKKLMKMMFEE